MGSRALAQAPGLTFDETIAILSGSTLPNGFTVEIPLPDGRTAAVMLLLFGRAALHVFDDTGRRQGCSDDVWDFGDGIAATVAAKVWDGQGEPEGWERHAASGRYRPLGDKRKQYVKRQ